MKCIALSSVLCLTSFASAASIFVDNHSFENPPLASGSFFYSGGGEIPGWTSTATGGADRGVWHTTAAGKDGINIAFAYRDNAVAQQLGEVVKANRIYTLEYLLGRTGNLTRGTAELWAGGTVANGVVTGGTLLASASTQLNQSNMSEYQLEYIAPSSGVMIGELLTVRIAGTTVVGESYVSFDNIRVTEAVPEPGTLAALALGLAALRRRR